MVRNPKAYKVKRGGGRAFSRDLSRLDADGNAEGKPSASSDESSSEESSEEDEEDVRQNRVGQLPPIVDSESEGEEDTVGLARNLNSTLSTVARPAPTEAPTLANSRLSEMTTEKVALARKERKAAAAAGSKKGQQAAAAAKKVKGSDESSEESETEENENRKGTRNMKASALSAPRELSRKEKEQADKLAAKDRYDKLHAAGKTDEARSDLSRLAEVKRQREIAAAKRIAETAVREEAAAKAFEKSGKKGPLKR